MRKLFLLLLWIAVGELYGQQALTGKWYAEKVTSADKTNTIANQEQILEIRADNSYQLTNFLGVSQQGGIVLKYENTLLFSDREQGYFAVFVLMAASAEHLHLRYLPFQNQNTIDIFLKAYKESPPPATPTDSTKTNFGGVWHYQQDGQNIQMSLLQDGKNLFGTHCSGLNCLQEYKIVGEIDNQTATVSILDKDRKAIAQATLTLNAQKLHWKITQNRDKVQSLDDIGFSK